MMKLTASSLSHLAIAALLSAFAGGVLAATDTLKTEAIADGNFKLINQVQAISAHITRQGLTISSIANNSGKDAFTLSLAQWGSKAKAQDAQSSKIYAEKEVIYHSYASATQKEGITEQISNTKNGIQQSFIVPVKLQDTGSLYLHLNVDGAAVNTKSAGAQFVFKSGRQLSYDNLVVTDSKGQKIPAHILVPKINRITLVVDDAKAVYPLTIRPVIYVVSTESVAASATEKNIVKTETQPVHDDTHSAIKLEPEMVKAIQEMRKPAPGDGEQIKHADGSVTVKLGKRYHSIPIATIGPDGKLIIDYHGEAHVPEQQSNTPPNISEPTQKQ